MQTTIFIALILGGLGFPIPEELPLLLAGLALAQEPVGVIQMLVICYAGVLIGDQTMYLFGYLFGQKVLKAGANSTFFPGLTPERIDEVREGLRKRRLVYVFVGRHLFFLRSATFVVAGTLRVPYWEFLIADALAALVSVALFVFLGYMFGGQLSEETLSHIVRRAHIYIVVFVMLIGAGVYCYRMRVKGKAEQVKPNEA
jgi:membrane protein DedA with SNARE-associated domain